MVNALAKMLPGQEEAAAPRVLVVDDNANLLELYRKILTDEDEIPTESLDALEAELFATSTPAGAQKKKGGLHFDVEFFQSGEQACQRALAARNEDKPFSVAFVDMRMPGGWDGMQTIEALWVVDPAIHVVICTAFSDYSWEDITDKFGQSDRLLILRKPFEKIEVLQMASALARKWLLHREQQSEVDQLEQRVAERTRDLTAALAERAEYANQLQYQATHDTLTGLANRNLLSDRLSQAIAYSGRYNHPLWVAFVDLDRFKVINDTLGHKAGDFVLNTMAERLRAILRETDTIARIGGDEFVLILRGPEHNDLSTSTLQRILDVIEEPMALEGRSFSLSCSIGVAAYPADGTTPESLVERADIAMYRAKESGRSNFQFFTPEMNLRLLERVHMEQALRHAITHEEFELHYQPQVDLRTGQIVGMEALIRWNHPGMGPVSPGRFIVLAEESGLIGPIGAWVLRTACVQNKAWQLAGLRPLPIAVNFSARQLMDVTLAESIGNALKDSGLDPAFLEIEITETSVMADVEYSIEVLRSLKKLGVHMSIDDFGTGYSSLAYLKRFPIDVLKIDQSFVHDVESDPDSAAIVLSIISLAHSLRLQVIAEGVETRAQLAYLQRHNCDMIQGFYFCKPVPAAEFEAILLAEKCLAREDEAEYDSRDTLLIVDDEASALEIASIVLGQDGYRILTAQTAVQAFEMLAQHRVGVVVCDQRMPAMDGVEFLSRIKGLYPGTARIMLSAYDESATVIDAVNRGAIFSYLVKPCPPSVLRESVREAFRFYRECLLQGAALAERG